MKKSKQIKNLERRVQKLEKVISENTSIELVNKSTEAKEECLQLKNDVTELPEKWCIKTDRQEVVDYCDKNGAIPPYAINSTLYAHYPAFEGCTTYAKILKGYTEITFDQFKKWVLKEDVSKMENTESDDKEKEIDWSIAGQLLEYKYSEIILLTNGKHHLNSFEGFVLNNNNSPLYRRSDFSEHWDKKHFKLCTKAIALSN